MKIILYFSVAVICLGFAVGCKKSSSYSPLGTHQFSGTCDFIFTGFVSFPPAADSNVVDSFTTVITKSSSPDSSSYLLLPVQLQTGPWGEPYLIFATTSESYASPVAIQVTDTLLTIPSQLPISGMGISIDGTGSIVNGKITLSYHSNYRNYNKYSTVVSTR
jgi:hypothetical protein